MVDMLKPRVIVDSEWSLKVLECLCTFLSCLCWCTSAAKYRANLDIGSVFATHIKKDF